MIAMKERKRVYSWYLVLSIVYSSIMVLTGVAQFLFPKAAVIGAGLWFLLLLGIVAFLWGLFNIAILVTMLIQKIERIALWLPGLYIFDKIFSVALAIIAVILGMNLEEIASSPILLILGLLLPVITLWLAVKLLTRKQFVNELK